MTSRLLASLGLFVLLAAAHADPLHVRIDRAVEAGFKGPFADICTDADFLRRASLDFTGIIPTADDARAFLKDQQKDKRERLIKSLAEGPLFARRMMEVFHVMFLERRTTPELPQQEWETYLMKSFAANKPFDQLTREILTADTSKPELEGSDRFYLERGGDLHLLTKDVGRLFLGRDIECSRCHDHPTVPDYLQRDYYGVYLFLSRSFVAKQGKKSVFAEKADKGIIDFESVFTMEKGMTGAHLPGEMDIMEPVLAKGEEYIIKPEVKKGIVGQPKFSPRAVLAEKVTRSAKDSPFVRNAVNRLWFTMMGRGVVHPLDMIHKDNPGAQPELLNVLAEGFVELRFDVRAFLVEIARSKAYQRSSRLPKGGDEIPDGTFAVAELRPLSPEQMAYSVAQATGALTLPKETDPAEHGLALRKEMAKSLAKMIDAQGIRKGEAEVEFQPALSLALYLSNDPGLMGLLKNQALVKRLGKHSSDAQIAEDLYLSVLTRLPTDAETARVSRHLKRRDSRTTALEELAWSLLASTEFRLNH